MSKKETREDITIEDIFKILNILVEIKPAPSPEPHSVLIQAMKQNDIDKFRNEIKNNPDGVYEKDTDGYTPLHKAVVFSVDFIQLLLNAKVDIDVKNHRGETALHGAALFDNVPVAECLLNSKANIEAENNDKITPVLFASYRNNKDMVSFLLKQGASIYHQDARGHNALSIAFFKQNFDIADLIIRNQNGSERAKLLKQLQDQLQDQRAIDTQGANIPKQNFEKALKQLQQYLSPDNLEKTSGEVGNIDLGGVVPNENEEV